MLEKSAKTKSVKSVESIFSYMKREKIRDKLDKLVVVSAENPFGELGYEVCEKNDPRGQKVSSEINRYYSDAQDAHMPDGTQPDFVPIKKSGKNNEEKYYVGVRYGRAILVLEPPPHQVFESYDMESKCIIILPGLRMKHFLLLSRNEQKYLDIISVHPDIDSFPVLFSFRRLARPHFIKYSSTGFSSDVTENFVTSPGVIYTNFRPSSDLDWFLGENDESAAFILLHEFGHRWDDMRRAFSDLPFHLSDDVRRAFSDQYFHLAELERNAHAFALFIASKINKKYPDEGFFDLKALRDIAQKFLTAYDPASLGKPRTVEKAKDLLRKQASNLRRNEARKMLLDLKEKSMIHKILKNIRIFKDHVESLIRQVPSLRRKISK